MVYNPVHRTQPASHIFPDGCNSRKLGSVTMACGDLPEQYRQWPRSRNTDVPLRRRDDARPSLRQLRSRDTHRRLRRYHNRCFRLWFRPSMYHPYAGAAPSRQYFGKPLRPLFVRDRPRPDTIARDQYPRLHHPKDRQVSSPLKLRDGGAHILRRQSPQTQHPFRAPWTRSGDTPGSVLRCLLIVSHHRHGDTPQDIRDHPAVFCKGRWNAI